MSATWNRPVRSRAVCWLLKQARAAVGENEEAASSKRPRYEARHMPSAAVNGDGQSRRARGPQAAQQQQRSAQKIVRHSPRCPAYSRNSTKRREDVRSKRHGIEVRGAVKPARALAHDEASRRLQRASRSGKISRTGSKTTNGVVQFQSR